MSTFQEKVMAQKLPREKVFRDPVHDYVHIHDKIILKLIDTREFQRLRRIKQLGTSSFTFHGAEHSRFNHSLGVYEITRRIIDLFERQYATKKANDGLWNPDEHMVTLCAALLHDIGHGAFSHTFEGIFNTDHEALTQQIITSSETEINQVLRYFGDDFPEKVASVINKTYPNQQVVQIISSQIDADRMDYLLRDAYYAGVSYGTFDLTRVLRVIRPYNNQIAFDYSGMHAVEDYVVSRYQMYMQVYFHGVSRGMEQVLKSLLDRAKKLYLEDKTQMKQPAGLLKPFLTGTWTLQDYLLLDDHVMSTYFSMWIYEDDPILSDLAYRFVNRKPFKSLIVTEENREALAIALQDEMIQAGFDPDYYFGINSSYDLPYDYYRPNQKKQRTQIELLTKTYDKVELSQVSALVNTLAGEVKGDLRLYFPGQLMTYFERIPADKLTPNQQMILVAHEKEYNNTNYQIQERLFN